ncbi:MAG: hypothetical protein GY706_16245, partial [Bacteroides sp.]|nr:hypothetical protein [Bacteroides sp.]
HDKRRHKRIDRLLAKKRNDLDSLCKKIRSETYSCRADAEAAEDKLHATTAGSYHKLDCTIEKVAKYSRGRPAKGKPRIPVGYEYQLHLDIVPDEQLVQPLRVEAGCFVLISNLASDRALYALLYHRYWQQNYRLEEQTDRQTDRFYDDDQVFEYTSFESRN